MPWSSAMASFSCGIDALMFGSLMMLASGVLASSPSSARASLVRWSSVEVIGEGGDDPAGQRDVAGLDRHPRRAGVGLDDREERVGGEQRRFVRVRVDDRRVRHRRHATGAAGTLVSGCHTPSVGSVGVTRSTRGLAAVDTNAQRRRATSTSAFGVSRRENHDASGFYGRFPAPILSADDTVEPPGRGRPDLRRRRPLDGPGPAVVGGAGGHLAAVLRRQGLRGRARRGPHPRHLRRVPHDARGRVRRVRREARGRRPHRGQRRQPRPQALPLAVRRRDRHPAGPPRPAPARRGDLAQGARRGRQLRLGLVQDAGQPRAARPHRARGDREQGPLRPCSQGSGPGRGRACRRWPPPPPTSSWTPPSTCGSWRPESADARRPPGAVPGGAAAAADRPLHLRGRRRARPVHGLGHHRRRRGARRPALPRLRHRRGLREGGARARRRRGRPGAGQPRPGPARQGRRGRRRRARRRPASRSPIRRPPSAVASPVASASTGSPPTRRGDEWLVHRGRRQHGDAHRAPALRRALPHARRGGRAHHRRPPRARAHHRPPGPRLGAAGGGGRRPWRHARRRARAGRHRASPRGWRPTRRAASTNPSASSCPASDRPGRRCRRPRPRSPRSSPARPSPARPPSRRASPTRRVANVAPEVWARLRRRPRRRPAPPGVRRGVGQRPGVPRRRAGPARAPAVARRVEGAHPGARRRGGARPTSASTTCG